MIKRVLYLMVSVCLGLGMVTGCSSNKEAEVEEEHYYDEDFIKDLGKALEARWALTDKETDYTADYSENHKKIYTSYIDAELGVLGDKDYANAKFEDSKLKEKAIAYLNCLSD